MSVKLIDENTINIYLKKENIENVNLKDKLELEKYLKSLFKKLNEYYNLKIEGYYDIGKKEELFNNIKEILNK